MIMITIITCHHHRYYEHNLGECGVVGGPSVIIIIIIIAFIIVTIFKIIIMIILGECGVVGGPSGPHKYFQHDMEQPPSCP